MSTCPQNRCHKLVGLLAWDVSTKQGLAKPPNLEKDQMKVFEPRVLTYEEEAIVGVETSWTSHLGPSRRWTVEHVAQAA